MIDSYRVVVVTPAGRKRYMEILFKYILSQKNVIDEYRIWVNTLEKEDLDYFKELEKQYKGFVTLDTGDGEATNATNLNICKFFKNCIDEKTVYVRLDDDVVYIESDFIEKIVKYRIKNKNPFLVYGTIINNACVDYILQKMGMYTDLAKLSYECLCPIGWRDPVSCELKHNYFINNFLSLYKIVDGNLKVEQSIPKLFYEWYLNDYERVSINCISWLGSTFKEFNGEVGHDEEQWLSVDKPKEIGKPNVIYGEAICSHFAFHTQRAHMDGTDILKKYKTISNIANKLIEL